MLKKFLTGSALFIYALLPGAVFAQPQSQVGTTGSAEAQLRTYRALAAAADDVARQVEERLGAFGASPSLVLYDPRIVGDLVVLKGFETELDMFAGRLEDYEGGIEGLLHLKPPVIKPPPSDWNIWANNKKELSKIIPPIIIGVKSPHGVVPRWGSQSAGNQLREQTDQIGNTPPIIFPALSPSQAPPAATPNPAPLFQIAPTTPGPIPTPVQVPAATPSAVSVTPFFPQTLSDWLAAITTLPAAISTIAGSTSQSNGVAGPANAVGAPSTAESFVVGKIAKRLPGTYYYPYFVPINVPDGENPLARLYDQQLEVHEDVARLQGSFKGFLYKTSLAFQKQLANDTFWMPPKEADALYARVCHFVKLSSPIPRSQAPALLIPVKDALQKVSLALAADDRLKGYPDQRKDVLAKLTSLNQILSSVIRPSLPLDIKNSTLALIDSLLSAQKMVQYSPPPAVKKMLDDMNTIINPVAGAPTTSQVSQVLTDIDASRLALQADDSIPAAHIGDTLDFLKQFSVKLQKMQVYLDPLTALMAVIDASVVSLNTVVAVKDNPQFPAMATSTDALSMYVIRGYDYRYLLRHGSKVLRVAVDMSFATDRLDTFGLNLPSRKSSAAAQLSFTIFDDTGKIESSGSSLAYLPNASPKNALTSGPIQISRDELEGVIAQAKPSILVREEAGSGDDVSISVFPQLGVGTDNGVRKRIDFQGAAFSCRVLDERGRRVGGSDYLQVSPGSWSPPQKVTLTDSSDKKKLRRYTVIVEAITNKDEFGNAIPSKVVASGSCNVTLKPVK